MHYTCKNSIAYSTLLVNILWTGLHTMFHHTLNKSIVAAYNGYRAAPVIFVKGLSLSVI